MKIKLLYMICSMIMIALLFHYAPQKNEKNEALASDISSIYIVNYDYIAHSSFGLGKGEYLIDIKNKLFYEFQTDYGFYYPHIYERNHTAENEGYKNVSVLSQDKIEKFLNILTWSNFLEWKSNYIESGEMYTDELVFDEHGHPTYKPKLTFKGLQWFILIGYKDGTYKKMRGQDKYPPDWNTMYFAFKDMVGTSVFRVKLEWTEVLYERFKAMREIVE